MIYCSDLNPRVSLSLPLSLSLSLEKEGLNSENHDSLRIYANWPVMIYISIRLKSSMAA
jgi:hypothetical protein